MASHEQDDYPGPFQEEQSIVDHAERSVYDERDLYDPNFTDYDDVYDDDDDEFIDRGRD